eukprot:TRINITY_DN3350_c0_g2_i1.p1 TRINITY_DN3350_c0_g2~~TRINITY_DN3350_c0_g2_i1.p1  ORF type:complete len:138 (+),score=34.33 TRINITY_DN3350_c0_g2_i1:768-1181(+)
MLLCWAWQNGHETFREIPEEILQQIALYLPETLYGTTKFGLCLPKSQRAALLQLDVSPDGAKRNFILQDRRYHTFAQWKGEWEMMKDGSSLRLTGKCTSEQYLLGTEWKDQAVLLKEQKNAKKKNKKSGNAKTKKHR